MAAGKRLAIVFGLILLLLAVGGGIYFHREIAVWHYWRMATDPENYSDGRYAADRLLEEYGIATSPPQFDWGKHARRAPRITDCKQVDADRIVVKATVDDGSMLFIVLLERNESEGGYLPVMIWSKILG